MSTTEKLIQILGVTYTAYSAYRVKWYVEWCVIYAKKTPIDKSKLIENIQLYNWYLSQWVVFVEKQFYRDIQDYINAKVGSAERYCQLIQTYPPEIEQYFPKAILIKMIKKEAGNHE